MMVESMEHGKIKISTLGIGDHVKTFDPASKSWKYTKVVTYLHRDEDLVTDYFILTTNQNRTLKLSAYHLIAKFENNRQDFIFAKDLKIGDLILSQDFERVVDIEIKIEKGAYAPLTEDGTLYVNDILVSCYANIQSHKIAHFAMQPLIFMSKFFGSFETSVENSKVFSGNSFWYSDFLFSFVTSLPAQLSNFIFTVKL
jgi:hypothetical protein